MQVQTFRHGNFNVPKGGHIQVQRFRCNSLNVLKDFDKHIQMPMFARAVLLRVRAGRSRHKHSSAAMIFYV